MKLLTHIFVSILITLFACIKIYGQNTSKEVTLGEVIDQLSLKSSAAQIEKLNHQNEILQFENYKKSFLPAVWLNFNPVNFNRSLRLLQQPSDGSYSYVEDYSNNSSAGVSVRQKIGITGGELNIGSNVNYLNEFSRKLNSFSTTPFSIGYSQQLWGGGKQYRLEKEIEYAKNKAAIKEYCTKLSQIQQQALGLYMTALLGKMEQDLAQQTTLNTDTLLQLAHIKLNNGHITEYDFKQIELQSLNARYAFENARKNYIEAQERLAVFLGIEEIEVEIPEFDIPFAIETSMAMFYVERNNPFSKQQEIHTLEAERNLFSVKLSNRFNGNISLNYGVNQYAETFAGAYRNGNTRQSVIIGFQIPVFQWGVNKNRIQIAENNYEASKIARERQMREFKNEVKENINNYNHSVKLWLTTEKAYKLSQEQYEMLIQKFSLGKVSVYELTTAQSEQNNAMQRYYSAIRDTYNSYFILRSMALYDFKQNVELEEVLV
ncbi:MAG: TolC family protein [Paludibacter sp.]|nr:TolC family protein [Paludibacter sp.]MDD4198406.1 TolC family protein [Paludibacter sp.]MDD4427084.1 TolC family protein [Paludibacter sp.]